MELRQKRSIARLTPLNTPIRNGQENLTSDAETKDSIQEFLTNNNKKDTSFYKDQIQIHLQKHPETIQVKLTIPIMGTMTASFSLSNEKTKERLTAKELSEGIENLIGMAAPKPIASKDTIEEVHRDKLSNFHQAEAEKSA